VASEARRDAELIEELAASGVEGAEYVVPPARIASGFSNELWTFEVRQAIAGQTGPMVLRVHRAASSSRERILHREVARSGFPTAQPVLSGGADSAFGQPYTVMRRLEGGPAVELGGLGAMRAARDAPTLVASAMAELHDLDPGPARAALRHAGVGDRQLGVDAMLDEIAERSNRIDVRALDALRRTAPRPTDAVIVHGDLHALNLWREPNGRIAVLDWELATLGPPELDVARSELLFSLVPGVLPRPARPLIMAVGRRSARSFRAAYSRRRTIDGPALGWYRALHALRLSALLATRAPVDPVADQWQPVAPQLRRIVEDVSGVRAT
jgi:aminoglycoside phosphotransferase (APT) family kinase protein